MSLRPKRIRLSSRRKRIRPQKKFNGQDANKSVLLNNGKIRERADDGICGFTQSAYIDAETANAVRAELDLQSGLESVKVDTSVKDKDASPILTQHTAELAYEGFKRMVTVAFQDNRSGRRRLETFMKENPTVALTPLPSLTKRIPCERLIAPSQPEGMTNAEYQAIYEEWRNRVPLTTIRYLSVDSKTTDKDMIAIRVSSAFIGVYDYLVPVGGNTGAAETWNKTVFQVTYKLNGEELNRTFSQEDKANEFAKSMKGQVKRKQIQVRPQKHKDERYQAEQHRQEDRAFNENTTRPCKERSHAKLNYNRFINATRTGVGPELKNGKRNHVNFQVYNKGEGPYDQ